MTRSKPLSPFSGTLDGGRRMTDEEARRAVLREFRSSPITRSLIWEAEKVIRPVLAGSGSGRDFDEAVVREAGLADLYRREVERRKRGSRA